MIVSCLLLTTVLSAQKEEKVFIDSQGAELSEDLQSEAVAYELRQLDRKGRLHGTVKRFSLDAAMLEMTNYKKGVKTGKYLRFDPATSTSVQGEYEKDKRKGAWVGVNTEGETALLYVEYYKGGELTERSDNPILKSEGDVLMVVETKPRFPGGPQGWTNFLRTNLKYPREATRAGIQGTVKVNFVVLKTGEVVAAKVTESPNSLLSKEALRIMHNSPDWIPATLKGEPIARFMDLQIVFKLR